MSNEISSSLLNMAIDVDFIFFHHFKNNLRMPIQPTAMVVDILSILIALWSTWVYKMYINSLVLKIL